MTGIEIGSIITALIVGLTLFVIRRVTERLRRMEEKQTQFITRKDAKEMITDNTNPLRSDIKRLESRIEELIRILLNR